MDNSDNISLDENGTPLHGLYRKHHDNGKIAFFGHYKHGRAHGVHKEWYSNGAAKSMITYIEGQAITPFKGWHDDPDRTHKRHTSYVTNMLGSQKHGLCVIFSSSNIIQKITLYDRDREVDCATHSSQFEQLLRSDEAKRLEAELNENAVRFTLT